MKNVAQVHWDYFLLLEKDLIAISEIVELCEKNYPVFGPKIVQLVLSAGSELDSALKTLAINACPDHIAAKKSQPTMRDFKAMILDELCEQFSSARVSFRHTDLLLEPWAGVAVDSSIIWWDSYNEVKHHRDSCYEKGNLETALNLIAALFAVDAFVFETKKEMCWGFTRIVDWSSDSKHAYMPKLQERYAELSRHS